MSKEWKGNSNSLHAAIAAHRGGGKSMRQEDDFYATDPKALEMLLDHCSVFLYDLLESCKSNNMNRHYATYLFGYKSHFAPSIWECACGNGNLYRVLRDRGYNCIYSDIKDRSTRECNLQFKDMLNVDFLQTRDWVYPGEYNVAVILTNPPLLSCDGVYRACVGYITGWRFVYRVYEYRLFSRTKAVAARVSVRNAP